MRNVDFSPLMRATVGFDRLMNLLDTMPRMDEAAPTYPPYNIEKTGDNTYRITMAVAGFGEDDISISVKEDVLSISGSKEKSDTDKEDGKFLYRGIATRSFTRRFDLADHIKVVEAALENGILSIDLVREIPEAMKPRTIKINAGGKAAPKTIEGKAA